MKQISCCVVIEYVCTAPVPPCAYRSRSAVASIFTLPPDRARPSIPLAGPPRPLLAPRAAGLPTCHHRRLPARARVPARRKDKSEISTVRLGLPAAGVSCYSAPSSFITTYCWEHYLVRKLHNKRRSILAKVCLIALSLDQLRGGTYLRQLEEVPSPE